MQADLITKSQARSMYLRKARELRQSMRRLAANLRVEFAGQMTDAQLEQMESLVRGHGEIAIDKLLARAELFNSSN